jgi:hypothetical protein
VVTEKIMQQNLHELQQQQDVNQLAQIKQQQAQPSQHHKNQQRIENVQLNLCYVKANDKIRKQTRKNREHSLPLFASIVRAPSRIDRNNEQPGLLYWTAHFTLCHKTWRVPKKLKLRIPQWTNDAAVWRCDGQEAVLEGNGDVFGDSLNIRCPQTDPKYIISNITVYNYTYHVRDYVDCEINHPLKKPAPNAKVAAAVVIFKMNLHQALEWIEYHRLLGVDHFFLYVMDAELLPLPQQQQQQQGWPDLDYITYIPWNLNPDMRKRIDIFLFQTAAQVDSILRGRALGLDWITMNDMDEYIVPRGNNNRTFRDYLADHLNDDQVPAIQGETVSFGNPPGTNESQPMVLDYVWRSIVAFGNDYRTKCIVRPMHVDYYRIHFISGSTHPVYYAPLDELWIHHYKKPQSGVFLWELPTQNITMDTTLRDRYSAIVETKVEDILSRMTDPEITVSRHRQL